MLSRSLLAATAMVATAFAVCAPAQAAAVYSDIDGGNGVFAHSGIAAGAFSDTFNFSVPTAGTQDVDVTFRFKSGLSDIIATLNGAAFTFTTNGNGLSGSLSQFVATGPQILQISGKSVGGGAYSGTVAFTSAVPELATWLMMIAGVGFTGSALRRRKAEHKVTYAF